jgi:hypothetical protein
MKKPILRRKSTRPAFRPRLESLETRLTPTTYTVSSLADSGQGSLRAAITSVNGDTSPDEIDFSVAGVIKLTSGTLPGITNTVRLNGRSAAGFTNAPLVELDNNGFGGLTLSGSNSILSSLSIVNSGGAGVTFEGADNITVVGNYIGLTLDGSALANKGGGLSVDNSTGALIGGTTPLDRNVISGNGTAGAGITLEPNGFDQIATIEGNFIGTDPAGLTMPVNQVGSGEGIEVRSSGNNVGGTAPGAGNVIAFNSVGVRVSGGSGNPILGNSIHDNGIGIQLNNGNQKQPFPLLVFAIQTGVITKINGILTATANATYSVQLFASPAEIGGQANTMLGTVSLTSNAIGVAAFTFSAQVPPNFVVTSIATSSSGNSSEISRSAVLHGTANAAYVSSAYGFFFNRGQDAFSNVWVDQLNGGVAKETLLIELQASDEYLRNQVAALYNHYLQRSPDSGGGQTWFDYLRAGGTFEGMAAGLTSSPEYLLFHDGTNPGFVVGLYHDVLNRGPSDAEVAGWVEDLNLGASRLDVSVAFLTSQEYRTELVQADYLTFLLRQADPGGLAAWVNALNAGATDQEVLAGIFGSPEGYQLWS